MEEWVGDKSCIPSPTSACSFMRKALSVTVDGASRSRFAAASGVKTYCASTWQRTSPTRRVPSVCAAEAGSIDSMVAEP